MEDSGVTGIALLVVDLQTPFINAVQEPDRLRRRCRFAVEAAGLLGIPVFATEQAPDKLGATEEAFIPSEANARVYAKTDFSSLRAEGLLEQLREQSVRHLLILGIETSICVYQSAIDALREQFEVTVLTDCVSCRRAGDGADVLHYLAQRTDAHTLPSESVFYSLLGSAKHPTFRAFTKLVKASS